MKIIFLFILFCIFFLIDFMCHGYLHNWILTFLFCFPIAIKDFIVMDKKEFRGYRLSYLLWSWWFWQNYFTCKSIIFITFKISKIKNIY